MDEHLLNYLIEAEKERQEKGIKPDTITFNELVRLTRASLNRLYEQKKIKVGDTMNDKYIKVLHKESE